MVANKQIYQTNKPYGYTARVALQGGLARAQFVNAGHNDAILHFQVLILLIYCHYVDKCHICFRSITLSLSIMQLSMQVMLTPFCVIYHFEMRGVLCFTKVTKFITLSRSNEQWLVMICPMFSFSPCKNVQQMFNKECWASPPCVWGEGVHGNIRSFITTLGKGSEKNRLFLGKSPKLWVGGGQES